MTIQEIYTPKDVRWAGLEVVTYRTESKDLGFEIVLSGNQVLSSLPDPLPAVDRVEHRRLVGRGPESALAESRRGQAMKSEDFYDPEAVEAGVVSMIASGYEWDCPVCGELNRLSGIPKEEHVVCGGCSYQTKFETPSHAYE